jgi:XrtN system VIT domain protein
MENNNTLSSKDSILLSGLGSITLSAMIFYFSEDILKSDEAIGFSVFFCNYAITVIYSIVVWAFALRNHRGKVSNSKIEYTVLMLILWFISAFALNRVMNVLDESVEWLTILITASCIALILGVFNQKLPLFVRFFTHYFLGIAFVLFVYYAFYLTPLYAFSFPAMLAIGISMHTYIPLLLGIVTATLCIKNIKQDRILAYYFFTGIASCLIITIFFLISWDRINDRIIIASNQNTLAEGKLPNWAIVSQSIPKNFVSERLIKADLVYKTVETSENWLWEGFPNQSFEEPMKHDPLVMISSLILKKTNLDEKERIKILESMYDSRQQAQERLWSGDKLQTSNVISNIKIFPEYRIAYTEKILSIRNTSHRTWNTQEAIYTFHLPEGSVVSSLSLWINGREEKAYLTSKSKADSAYKQIVGVENRDPSVIHWQEGNTVSVRVFPCTVNEDRKFKIGVSSPLRRAGDQLAYENIYFDGPTGKNASETLRFSFSNRPENLEIPKDWEEISDGMFQVNRKYKPYWELSCKTPEISSSNFSFNNHSYQIKNYAAKYTNFDAETIYLDLNSSWTKEEFSTLWEKIKNKEVFTFEDKLVRLSEENKDSVFKRLNQLNFSLFPVYKIINPKYSLIISKSTETSPNLSDLKDTEFANRTATYLQHNNNIRLYNIGTQLSPYLKTLKELRVFNYQSGSFISLIKLIENKKFIVQQENEKTVLVGNADLLIEETISQNKGNAPDHLLRLFAYNDIMKKVAVNYFNNDFIQPDVLTEAETANIVTPVSSLIVLETQKDYERFNIDESKNSLKNASMKSSGAVPEPHEWLMILLTAGIVIYLMRKPVSNSIC